MMAIQILNMQEKPAHPRLRRGSHLGKYRLTRRLGQGGFGDVWRATDTVEGISVALGGFHVSGCISMLPEIPADIQEAVDLGVSLFAGDRILIKDQTDDAENGIYIVQSSGAPDRAPAPDRW